MEDIETLRRNIASATDPREKVMFLLQLGRSLLLLDFQRGAKAVRDALRISRRLDDPRLIIETLFQMESYYFGNEQYSRILDAFTEIGGLLEKLPDEYELRVRLCHRLGSFHLMRGDFRKGLEVLTSAFGYLDRVNTRFVILILGTAADTYLQIGDYQRALALLGRAAKLAEDEGFPQYVARCVECTARIYVALGDNDTALEKFRRARDLLEAVGERMGVGSTLGNIARILIERNDVAGALEVLEESIAVNRTCGTRQIEAGSLLTMANIVKRSNADAALKHQMEALAIYEGIGDRRGRSRALADIGSLHAACGKPQQAIPHFLEALRLAEEIQYPLVEQSVHESLAAIYEKLGDAETSLGHYKRYMELEREMQGQEMQKALAMAGARAEIERAEKEKEIALLKNLQLRSEMERKSKELTAMALRLVQNNELMDGLKGDIRASLKERGDARSLARTIQKRIEERTRGENAWRMFEEQFQQIHQDFLTKLHDRYPTLRPAELKICALLKINLPSKEIASLLNISFRTVELHRTNIRRKLSLPNATNLSLFLTSL